VNDDTNTIRSADGRLAVELPRGPATWDGTLIPLPPLARRVLVELLRAGAPQPMGALCSSLKASRGDIIEVMRTARAALRTATKDELTIARASPFSLLWSAAELESLTRDATADERLLAEFMVRIADRIGGEVRTHAPAAFVRWIGARGGRPQPLGGGPLCEARGVIATLARVEERKALRAVRSVALPAQAFAVVVLPHVRHDVLWKPMFNGLRGVERVDRDGDAVLWTAGFGEFAD
jgi:hypothetical protein